LRYVAIGTYAELDIGQSININAGGQINFGSGGIIISQGTHADYSGFGGKFLNFNPNWPGTGITLPLTSMPVPFIGIGTDKPLQQLHISAAGDHGSTYGWNFDGPWGLRITGATNQTSLLYGEAIGNGAQAFVEWIWSRARGTMASPLRLEDGDVIGSLPVTGYTDYAAGSNFGLGAIMTTKAVGAFTQTSTAIKFEFSSARSGSTSLSQSLWIYGGSISVGGAIDPGAGGYIGLLTGAGLVWANNTVLFYESGNKLFANVSLVVNSSDAIPAGGNNAFGYKFSTATNFGVFFGSGAPTQSAAKGSIYLRSDGTTTNNRAYINTDGGTTWTAVTTVA
jgi:hypothetical protein